MMNPDIKQKWLTALRSGQYEQGQHCLRSTHEGQHHYCCLGVLCDLYAQEHPEAGWVDKTGTLTEFHVSFSETDSALHSSSVLPKALVHWAGLEDQNPRLFNTNDNSSVAEYNDGGFTFPVIADLIEQHL